MHYNFPQLVFLIKRLHLQRDFQSLGCDVIRLLKEQKDNYNERDDMANDTFFMLLLKIHECMSKKLPNSPN